MYDGYLIQHLEGHGGVSHRVFHEYADDSDFEINLNSYHHQMMVPSGKALLLGFTDGLCDEYIYDTRAVYYLGQPSPSFLTNNEIVYFGNGSLGIQSHPEYMDYNDPQAKLARKYVAKCLGLHF
jgi:hypothetical protein